jgi:hypothetical protein
MAKGKRKKVNRRRLEAMWNLLQDAKAEGRITDYGESDWVVGAQIWLKYQLEPQDDE